MTASSLGSSAWREGEGVPPFPLACLSLFGRDLAMIIVAYVRNYADDAIDDEIDDARVRSGIPPPFRADLLKQVTEKERLNYLVGLGYATAGASLKSFFYIGDRPNSLVSRVLKIPVQEVNTVDESLLSAGGTWDETAEFITYPTDPASVWARAGGASGPSDVGPGSLTARNHSGEIPLTRTEFDLIEDPLVVELTGAMRWLPLFAQLRSRTADDAAASPEKYGRFTEHVDFIGRVMLLRASAQAAQVGRLADLTGQYRMMTASEAAARLLRLLEGEPSPLLIDGWNGDVPDSERMALLLNQWGYPYIARLALERGEVGGFFQNIANAGRSVGRFFINMAGSNVGQAVIGAASAAVGVIVPPAGVALALAGAAANRLDDRLDAEEAAARQQAAQSLVNTALANIPGVASAGVNPSHGPNPTSLPATDISAVIARLAPLLAGIRLRLNDVKTNQFHSRRGGGQPYLRIHLH